MKKELEIDLKIKLIKHLINRWELNSNDTIINELHVGDYSRRVDLLVIKSGVTYAFEIKSEADSLSRLNGQIEKYSQFFDKVIVLCASKHLNKCLNLASKKTEIWESEKDKIKIVKKGKKVEVKEKNKLLDLMHSSDMKKLLKSKELDIANLKKFELKKLIEENLKTKEIRECCIKSLENRHKEKMKAIFKSKNLEAEIKSIIKPKLKNQVQTDFNEYIVNLEKII